MQLIDVKDGAFRCLFLRRIQRGTLRTPLRAPDLLLGPRVCLIVLPVSQLLIAVLSIRSFLSFTLNRQNGAHSDLPHGLEH